MYFLKIVEVLNSIGWLIFLLTTLVVFLLLRWFLSGPKNLPPGPSGLSLLCSLPFLITDPVKTLGDLSKKYGDVMSISLFGVNVIQLGSYEAIHEAFVTRGNEFAGRPEMAVFDQLMPSRREAIIFSTGKNWKIHRRFAMQTLRDFGFGKLSLEARIQENTKDVINVLEECQGRAMDVKDLMANSAANVICSLLFDRHFKLDDPEYVKFMNNFRQFLNVPTGVFLTNSYVLKMLPIRYISWFNNLIKANEGFLETMNYFIKQHQETFDPNFLRDYVDVFLDEMKKREETGDEKKFFTLDYLSGVGIDLFMAGTETTANTLHWALRILMYRPEIQKKVQKEIDQVIGRERLPENKDRMKMPYTEAVIQEVLRFSSLFPMSNFHSNSEELQFRNYTIPKNSIIIPNFWAVHYDPKLWPEPEKFDPTRFLSEDGKVIKKDMLLPFSLGKRVCLGESLARTEVFIFLTSIFQHFNIVPPDGGTEPPLPVYLATFLRQLKPHKLCALKR